MNTKDGRKIIEQIVSTRSRFRFQHRETELFARLTEIKMSYKRMDPTVPEFLRYYPIALIACVESYFRLAIKELIDFGEPYLSNSRHLLRREGYDFDILIGLHGEKIAIGEVISHHPSISSIGHVIAIMDKVIDIDFRKAITEVYDRGKVEIEKRPKKPIISDIGETLCYVGRTFELRHVLCHETATAVQIETEEIDKFIYHTTIFLKSSDELISQILFPDAPLTQADMNRMSYSEYEKERESMDMLVSRILNTLSNGQNEQFVIANKAWEEFFNSSVEVEALQYEGGSIMPTIANVAAARLVRDRKKQLERLLEILQEDT